MRSPCVLLAVLLTLAGVTLGACTQGRGAPVFGQRDLPPTRTIAGEHVPMERYGGAWADVARASPQDRLALAFLWTTLEDAGIPASALATGGAETLRVPAPHAAAARRLLRTAQASGADSAPHLRYRVLSH